MIFFCLRLKRLGVLSVTAMTMQKDLLPLPGLITITTTEPDMITFDNSYARRAKMPCGHVISQESMTDYCQSIFAHGKHEFICPYPGCNVEWQYFLVKHVANLTQQQMKEFEARISKSELSKDKRNQMCPRCQTWCRRDDLVNNCMECPNCTVVQGGRKYLFCWACLCEWKSPGLQGNACGYPNCLDNRIQILSTCPEKMILSRMAPSVRGCPKCGTLYEYKEFCTQMHCSACNHFFCFYCLKGATTKAGLQCIPYNSTCAVASRQTVLPGIL